MTNNLFQLWQQLSADSIYDFTLFLILSLALAAFIILDLIILQKWSWSIHKINKEFRGLDRLDARRIKAALAIAPASLKEVWRQNVFLLKEPLASDYLAAATAKKAGAQEGRSDHQEGADLGARAGQEERAAKEEPKGKEAAVVSRLYWRQADHHDLARQALGKNSFRELAALIPGLIALVAILGALLALFASAETAAAGALAASDSGLDSLLSSSWPQSVFLLLAGLLVACIFYLLDALLARLSRHKTKLLFDQAARLIPVLTADDWQEEQLAALNSNHQALLQLGRDLTLSLQSFHRDELLPQLQLSYQTSIERELAPQVRQLGKVSAGLGERILSLQEKSMQELVQSFQATLSADSAAYARQQSELLQKLAALQAEATNSLQATLTASSENLNMQNSLNENTADTLAELAAARGDLSSVMANFERQSLEIGEFVAALDQLLAADHCLVEAIGEEREALEKTCANHMLQMGTQMQQMQSEFNLEVTEIFNSFRDLYATLFDNVDEQTHSLLDNFSEKLELVLNNLDEQVRDLSFVSKDVSVEIADLNNNLQTASADFSQNMVTSLEQYLLDMEASVDALGKKLAITTSLIHEAVDDLPAAVLLARSSLTQDEEDRK